MTESLIIKDHRYEIETKPSLGADGGFYCNMWEMIGTAKFHLYTIEYGATKEEARSKVNQAVIRLKS